MLHRTILPAVFLLFCLGCSDSDEQAKTNVDSAPHGLLDQMLQSNPLNPDTFRLIDNFVNDIRAKIKNNELTKKQIHGKDNVGGDVYGYYNPDKTVAYIYSSFDAELGRSERESFYKNDSLIYSDFRFYQFETDEKGNAKPNSPEHYRAEKLFYLPTNPFGKETVKFFEQKASYSCTADALFPESQMPKAKETAYRTNTIKEHLAKMGQ